MTDILPATRQRMVHSGLILLLAIQMLAAFFFIGEFLTEVLGLRTWALPFAYREVLQLLASLGLLIGTVATIRLSYLSRKRIAVVEDQLRVASGAFFDVMDKRFAEWGLSRSERDVALFALKGCTNAEIGDLRGTSEATVKSQVNAVLRKAGVSGRPQLMSLFLEELMAGPVRTAG